MVRGATLLLQTVSGIALGLLLGTLVGFSQSPVVAAVVGALTGGLVLFLGFNTKPDADGQPTQDSRAAAGRLAGFGFACTVALVFSLYARTHDTLSVAVATQVNTLKSAGYSEDEAHAWVAYKNAGLLLRMNKEAIADKDDKRAATAESVLFADQGVDPCFSFDRTRIADVNERITAMRNSGPRFVTLADAISKLDPAKKEAMMDGMSRLFCPASTP
jgi:hypothetical protein